MPQIVNILLGKGALGELELEAIGLKHLEDLLDV
jgi:hypothetical protein